MRISHLFFLFISFLLLPPSQIKAETWTYTYDGTTTSVDWVNSNWVNSLGQMGNPSGLAGDYCIINGGQNFANKLTITIDDANYRNPGSIQLNGVVELIVDIQTPNFNYIWLTGAGADGLSVGSDAKVTVKSGSGIRITVSGFRPIYSQGEIVVEAGAVLSIYGIGTMGITLDGPDSIMEILGSVIVQSFGYSLENFGGQFLLRQGGNLSGDSNWDFASDNNATYDLQGFITPGDLITMEASAIAPAPLVFGATAQLRLRIRSTTVGRLRVPNQGVLFSPGASIEIREINYQQNTARDFNLVNTDGPSNSPSSVVFPSDRNGFTWFQIPDANDYIVRYGAILPVQWASFTGETTHKTNELFWSTAAEVENEGFTVHRSADGVRWHPLGYSQAEDQLALYGFTDTAPLTGTNFYRIEQRDIDGSTSFSSVVQLNFAPTASPLVYPNPATNNINLTVENYTTAAIIDASGRVLSQQPIANGNIEISQLKPGSYLLRLVGASGVVTTRFIKQ
jgi:hypothetical protein